MAGEDAEQFTIYSTLESIASTEEFEGTNASRFAIAASLDVRSRFGAEGDDMAVDPSTLNLYGFRASLSPVRGGRNRGLFSETPYLRERALEWDDARIRRDAWEALAMEGYRPARLTLLAAGVCSERERESTVAAVAILRLLGDLEPGIVRRGWDSIPFFHRLPWGPRWQKHWDWPLAQWWLTPDVSSDSDAAGADVEWRGTRWRDFANTAVRDAVQWADQTELLAFLGWLASIRVSLAVRSTDPVTRQLALSARLSKSEDEPEGTANQRPRRTPSTYQLASTMVHGTWAWKGDWWYPGGDFHAYIKNHFRPRLYSDGMEYSWSGAYSQEQRVTAGHRFARWAAGHSPNEGMGTVFAHSYGGEVVARAVACGARVRELVLLSAPSNTHVTAALDQVERVVDVRLAFDIVLGLAREDQKLPPHPRVVQCILKKGFWMHGVTHTPELWRDEGVAAEVDL